MLSFDKDNIIIRVLISSRFRIVRHLLLIVFTVSIAAGFIWHMQSSGQVMTFVEKYGGLLFFALIFLAGCYLNIYVLTPRLLLKNKWGIHFGCLFGIVLLIMITIMVTQTAYFDQQDDAAQDMGVFSIVINILSSVFSIYLLFAGTSTLVLFKYWIQDMLQAEELESATLQLELKLLENQINPHFLFNMLNNANIMIKKDPDIAVHILARLEEMLRYQMNDSTRERVYLKEEILFLNDFLELEKTRRDNFDYIIALEGKTDDIQIVPLLFITFVENAVKHNTDGRSASYVHINFIIKEDSVIFICENSIPKQPVIKDAGGIGLANIKRRLDLLYSNKYSLKQNKTETKYTVELELKL